ncbi:hypothetical protein OH76DRAFT_1478941 [Lentinus brumalis]|uniref:Uncharacterized protein n=1 Tax=Lentinus brumalis TaxID=2498619 RepID=A0A371DQA0_9APHY|nr:hypothetical protein OH76DRAFT_1478941 [Polyporus brumalis]
MTDTPEQPTGEVRPAKRVREEASEPRGEDMESVVATEVARVIRRFPTTPVPANVTRELFDAYTMPYCPEFEPPELRASPADNPHRKLTRPGGQRPEEPLLPHQAFPDGPFPHTHIPEYVLLSNLKPKQVAAIREKGDRMLAAVVHGGGQIMLKHAKLIAANIEAFLRSLAFESNDRKPFNVSVYPPEANKLDVNKPFNRPLAFFIDTGEEMDALRAYLLWQEVFAVNQALSFTALPIAVREDSWKVCVITGDAVDLRASHAYVVQQKTKLLAAIKLQLNANTDLQWHTAGLVASNWNITAGGWGAAPVLAAAFTDTLSLELTSADCAEGGPAMPAYLVMARPLTYDKHEAGAWTADFRRAMDLRIDMDVFPLDKGVLDCKICKSDVHRTAACPLANSEGWPGVTPALLGRNNTDVGGAPTSSIGIMNPTETAQDIFRSEELVVAEVAEAVEAVVAAEAEEPAPATCQGGGRSSLPFCVFGMYQ